MLIERTDLRNIAIIAHVDHGKTTLVDFMLAILLFQGMILKAGRTAAWRVVALIVLFSIISAFVTYGIARAAEPLFPSLSTSVEENHHEEATPVPDHDH